MSDFGLAAYRGEGNIPHLPEQHFTCYFAGAQLALAMLLLPGRVFGSELRPRRFNRDYIWSVCEENARRNQARRGKKPTYALFKPKQTDHSMLKMWNNQLQWKSWMRERMGGGWIRSV
ncbi:hypothetical protein WJX73_007541 [Symbiochloris irregularis]|uniref:Uncharacterized protein n=1 Tax=Symbiochloris irregularis TaxID=706552 RepID=A0AAW1P9S3_9CHLO